ncbi:MAG: methyltransferase domain-containing protein [Betaproteobacteria bacterium]|nr:methyltransferase domain-containing protein [Betaproteobacteria bacterium]
MGFYAKWILPHLTDLATRNDEAARFRARIVPRAGGIVLEVGAGSGLNLPYYGANVERVLALEPSPELPRKARARVGQTCPGRSIGDPTKIELRGHEGIGELLSGVILRCRLSGKTR